MFEYIFVFVIVAVAAWYVGLRLWRDSRGQGCQNCSCGRTGPPARLIQIKPIDRKKH